MGKHREWRKQAKKTRRTRIRRKLAKERDDRYEQEEATNNACPEYQTQLLAQEAEERFQLEEEARISAEANARWEEAERVAQEEFQKLQQQLAATHAEKQRKDMIAKARWEAERARLKAKKDEMERLVAEKARQQKLLEERIEQFIENGGDVPSELLYTIETRAGREECPFFKKTAACRFFDNCSRNHIKPAVSSVLIMRNFFIHYSLKVSREDASLEFEDPEIYGEFKTFFNDVLTEMETMGIITQMKVCCNRNSHLRGNVYVEYRKLPDAIRAYRKFQGRYYAGKQTNVEFCTIDSWKSAICGLFSRSRCSKGSNCNFLHVFPNPASLFRSADFDQHRLPPQRNRLIAAQESSTGRDWRWSESPERPTIDNKSSDFDPRTVRKQMKSTSRERSTSSRRSSRRSTPTSDRSRRSRSSERQHRRESRRTRSSRSRSSDRSRKRSRSDKYQHSES